MMSVEEMLEKAREQGAREEREQCARLAESSYIDSDAFEIADRIRARSEKTIQQPF